MCLPTPCVKTQHVVFVALLLARTLAFAEWVAAAHALQ